VYNVFITGLSACAGLVKSYLGVHSFLGYLLVGMTLPHDIAKRVEKDFSYFLYEYGLIFFTFAGTKVLFTGGDYYLLAMMFIVLVAGSFLNVRLTATALKRFMNVPDKIANEVGKDMLIKGMVAIVAALALYQQQILDQTEFNAVMLMAIMLTVGRGVITGKAHEIETESDVLRERVFVE